MKLKKGIDSLENNIQISFRNEWTKRYPKEIMDILKNGLYINYDEKDLDKLEEEGIINGGEQSYFISPISSQDKFSTRYFDCQGMVASGINKKTGKNLSFFTHQDTGLLLNNKKIKNDFSWEIYDKIEELKSKSKRGSIDTIIFGGNGFFSWDYKIKKIRDNHNKQYLNGLEIISDIVKETLGKYPIIAHSPKQNGGMNDVFFDTHKNKLYIIDTGDIFDYSHRPFTRENISEMKELWESQAYQK